MEVQKRSYKRSLAGLFIKKKTFCFLQLVCRIFMTLELVSVEVASLVYEEGNGLKSFLLLWSFEPGNDRYLLGVSPGIISLL